MNCKRYLVRTQVNPTNSAIFSEPYMPFQYKIEELKNLASKWRRPWSKKRTGRYLPDNRYGTGTFENHLATSRRGREAKRGDKKIP
jgi:hypothetical protein